MGAIAELKVIPEKSTVVLVIEVLDATLERDRTISKEFMQRRGLRFIGF